MEFVNIDGESEPMILYKPYIYAEVKDFSIFYLVKDKKGYKTIYKDKKDIYKERDVCMRDPNRIEPFMMELAKIWKKECPDWRFGQLIENVFCEMPYNTWMLEEPRMLEEFNKYFNPKPAKKRGRKKGFNKE